jgi:hypothetical protein
MAQSPMKLAPSEGDEGLQGYWRLLPLFGPDSAAADFRRLAGPDLLRINKHRGVGCGLVKKLVAGPVTAPMRSASAAAHHLKIFRARVLAVASHVCPLW